jgi:hypothetical protein
VITNEVCCYILTVTSHVCLTLNDGNIQYPVYYDDIYDDCHKLIVFICIYVRSQVRNFEVDHSHDNVLIEYQAALKVRQEEDITFTCN